MMDGCYYCCCCVVPLILIFFYFYFCIRIFLKKMTVSHTYYIKYHARLFETGTNRELNDTSLILDISLWTLLENRDQPLDKKLSPEHCAIIRSVNRRGYLLISADMWHGSHVIIDGTHAPQYVFPITIQPINCSINDSQLSHLLSQLVPILIVQKNMNVTHDGTVGPLTNTNSQEFKYSNIEAGKDTTKPIGDYRLVICGAVTIDKL